MALCEECHTGVHRGLIKSLVRRRVSSRCVDQFTPVDREFCVLVMLDASFVDELRPHVRALSKAGAELFNAIAEGRETEERQRLATFIAASKPFVKDSPRKRLDVLLQRLLANEKAALRDKQIATLEAGELSEDEQEKLLSEILAGRKD